MTLRPLLLSALLLCAACQPETRQTAAPAASAAADIPVYHVATDATYPPFEFTDHRGDIIGLDIDLLNAIAEDQGFKVEYYHHPWEGMFGQLASDADILASAIAITEESKREADLSSSYHQTPYRAVSLKSAHLDDWQLHSISAGKNEDTIDDLKEEYGVAAKRIREADTVYLALTDVVKKEAELTVGDAAVLKYYMDSPTFRNYHFETKILPSADPETDKLVFAVKKGNRALLEKINAGLANLKKSGRLNIILKHWRQNPVTEKTS